MLFSPAPLGEALQSGLFIQLNDSGLLCMRTSNGPLCIDVFAFQSLHNSWPQHILSHHSCWYCIGGAPGHMHFNVSAEVFNVSV